MASWTTESQATEFSVGTTFDNAINARNRGSVTTGDTIKLTPFGDDSVVGINVNYIPTMKARLEAYIKEIEKVLERLDDNVNAREGVAGDDVNYAIKQYFIRVKEYLLALVSNFRAFNDKLTSVSEAYVKFQGSEKETIASSTAEISANKYNEQFAEAPTTGAPVIGAGHGGVAQSMSGVDMGIQ